MAWLADREIWPLLVGVALTTLTRRWASWGLALLGVLWLVRWLGRGAPSVRTPIDGPAVVLVALVPLTFWVTVDRARTTVAVIRLLTGLALAYGLVNWARDAARLSVLAFGLAGLSLGLATFGLISVEWPLDKMSFVPQALYRWTSARLVAAARVADVVNPNILAGALVMTLPFALAALLETRHLGYAGVLGRVSVLGRSWFRWAWYGGAVGASVVVLLLSQSRGAWLAELAAVWVLLLYRWPRLFWLFPAGLLGAVWGVWRALSALVAEGRAGQMGRFELWSRSLYLIQDMPYTGVGAGAFEPILDTQFPFYLHGAWVEHAHNLFLQVALDLGLPGLIAFVALLLLALVCAFETFRRYRAGRQPFLAALSWAGLASLTAMLVHGTIDATTWIVSRGAFVPWAVIGLLLALHRVAMASGRKTGANVHPRSTF
jgi:putative inorganic carbon (HCO3(-)) transporter